MDNQDLVGRDLQHTSGAIKALFNVNDWADTSRIKLGSECSTNLNGLSMHSVVAHTRPIQVKEKNQILIMAALTLVMPTIVVFRHRKLTVG